MKINISLILSLLFVSLAVYGVIAVIPKDISYWILIPSLIVVAGGVYIAINGLHIIHNGKGK